MTFRLTVPLVLAAVAFLVAAVLTGSPTLFLAAAVASALAVVLLWRYVRATSEHTFVSHPPPVVEPDWDRPLPVEDDAPAVDGRGLPAVAIEGYEDLVASEILPMLETLSIEELRGVIRREENGLNRQSILARAQRLIELTKGPDVDLREPEIPLEPVVPPTRSRRSTGRDESSVEQSGPGNTTSQNKGPGLSF